VGPKVGKYANLFADFDKPMVLVSKGLRRERHLAATRHDPFVETREHDALGTDLLWRSITPPLRQAT